MEFEIITRGGIEFYVRPGTVDHNVLDEVITGDCYRLKDINLRDKPNIVDVGGHIGGFSKYASTRYPGANIFVFEANKRNWEILKANVGECATVYEGALVGKKPVNRRLVISAGEADRVTGGWGIIYNKDKYTPDENTATEEIKNFYFIKDVFSKLDKVDILKLDCEGSEWLILEHMTDEELYKVDYLVAEIHCGALAHTGVSYSKIRDRILKQFICPALENRAEYTEKDLFNIIACNKKLLPKE